MNQNRFKVQETSIRRFKGHSTGVVTPWSRVRVDVEILQWPVVVALVAAGTALVYYVAPDVQQRLIWVVPGSVFATVVWLLVSLGFKWYVSAFANYQKTYGAIGGVMVALLWLYVSGLAILMGAE